MFICLCSEQSGCQIRLEEPKPGSTQRIITIIGHQSGIQLAQSLLQNRWVGMGVFGRVCVVCIGVLVSLWQLVFVFPFQCPPVPWCLVPEGAT